MTGDRQAHPVGRQATTGDRQATPVERQESPVGRQDTDGTATVAEAARLLGKSTDAIRSALRRGTMEGYRDNQGEWRIPWASLPEDGHAADSDSADALELLRQELDRTRAELEQAQRQASDRQATVAELRERVAWLKGEAAGHNAMVTTLRDALADLAQRLDLATAELRELRRPWWRRWMG
jgi:hypothetical protein